MKIDKINFLALGLTIISLLVASNFATAQEEVYDSDYGVMLRAPIGKTFKADARIDNESLDSIDGTVKRYYHTNTNIQTSAFPHYYFCLYNPKNNIYTPVSLYELKKYDYPMGINRIYTDCNDRGSLTSDDYNYFFYTTIQKECYRDLCNSYFTYRIDVEVKSKNNKTVVISIVKIEFLSSRESNIIQFNESTFQELINLVKFDNKEPVNIADLKKKTTQKKEKDFTEKKEEKAPVTKTEEDILKIKQTNIVNKDAVAVIIGNKNYSKKDVPSVEFAIEDAVTMKELLTQSFGFREENIIYLTDASQADFFSVFGNQTNYKGQLYNYVKPDKSDVFIYYSGHGAPDPESKTGYFVPVDCNPATVSLNGYSIEMFYKNISQIPAKGITVVLDACFSGGYEKGMLIKNISPIFITTDEKNASLPNGIVISSAKGDQVSSWYPDKNIRCSHIIS